MGTIGEVGAAEVQGRVPTGGARIGDNGTHPKREDEVSAYWTRRCGVEGLHNSGKLLVEAGDRLVRRLARVQRGTGNGDGHTGGQVGSTASRNCTQAPFPSDFRHLKGV